MLKNTVLAIHNTVIDIMLVKLCDKLLDEIHYLSLVITMWRQVAWLSHERIGFDNTPKEW